MNGAPTGKQPKGSANGGMIEQQQQLQLMQQQHAMMNQRLQVNQTIARPLPDVKPCTLL